MSRQFEHVAGRELNPSVSPSEFSRDEQNTLLGIAHQAIIDELCGQTRPEAEVSAKLREMRGVFTTLYLRGHLRGCVGYAMPVAPLFRAVAETARAAAFEDSRFAPVTRAEAPDLAVSISVLSPVFPIRPEQVEVGRHGLLISFGLHRGLLLPQVAPEFGWDREMFLEQTCRKAGLAADAWQKGARIEAFTAEVYSDAEN